MGFLDTSARIRARVGASLIGLTQAYASRAAAVASLPVDAFFDSDETGSSRRYRRTAAEPGYVDVGATPQPTKATVGLSDVDNTSDADKPVSTAQAVAVAAKVARGDLGAGSGAQLVGTPDGLLGDVLAGTDTRVIRCSALGIVDDGTSQHARWQLALNAASATGKKLIVDVPFLLACPDGQAFLEPKVTNPAKLQIEGREFITVDAKSMALRIERTVEVETTVTAQTVLAWPDGAIGNYVTRLSVSNAAGFVAGRPVLVHATDLYAFDSTTPGYETTDAVGSERAMLVDVQQVDAANGYIYLKEVLWEMLASGVKVAMLRESDVDVSLKLTSSGDIDDQSLVVPDRVRDLVVEDFGVGSSISVRARRLRQGGIGLFSCFGGEYAVRGTKKCRNNPGQGSYPYGINVSGASRFCELSARGAGYRHCVTNTMRNSAASGELRKKGRQADVSATGSGYNTSSATWDTHPGALRWRFISCEARFAALDQNAVTAGQAGTQVGFQDRGEGTTYVNPIFDGNGLMFVMRSKRYNYGDYATTIVNPVSRKLSAYSAAGLANAWMSFASVDPANLDNQSVAIMGGMIRNQERLLDWHDYSTPVVPYGRNITVRLGGGLLLHNVDKIEVGGSGANNTNLLIIDGVTRSCYSATPKTFERLYAYNNGVLRCFDYRIDLQGSADMSAGIAAFGGGAANITIGTIVSNKTAVSFTDYSITSGNVPSITYVKTRPLRGSLAYDAPSLAPGGSTTANVPVIGASTAGAAASTVTATFSGDLQGIQLTAWISAANQVTVRLTNPTSAPIDLPAGTLLVTLDRWT